MDKNKLNIIKNFQYIFISLGFLYLIGWAKISIIFLLKKIIILDKVFSLSNIFTYIIYAILNSLSNLIFFIILGFFIPFIILERQYFWSIMIGLLYTIISIMNSTIIIYSTSKITNHIIEIWIPYIVIIPSIILCTLFLSARKQSSTAITGLYLSLISSNSSSTFSRDLLLYFFIEVICLVQNLQ